MKKRMSLVLSLLLSASMLAACGQSGSQSGSSPASSAPQASETASADVSTAESINLENYRLVTVNMEGNGQVAIAEEGAALAFTDDLPIHSAGVNREIGSLVTIGAKPDEGYKILKWTKNGEVIGTEPEITFTLEDNTDFIVTFSKANPNENAKLADLKTVGDLYANVAELGSLMMEDKMVYGFELGGGYYRAIAEMTPDIFQAVMDLDMFDENYEEKQHELLAPLAVVRIEDLNKAALTKDEMDALAGKTVSELLADGWFFNGYNFEDMEFTADHDVSSYKLILEGEAPAKEDYSDEDLGPMTVVSVSYIGYSDLTNMEYEAPAAQ